MTGANSPLIADLISDLERRGVTLWAEGDEIRMRGRLSACQAQLDDLRRRKTEVMEHFRQQDAIASQSDQTPLIDQSEAIAFAAIGPGGFAAMLDPSRLIDRSADFDRMILSSDNHSWSSLDPRYFNLEAPFDVTSQPIIDEAAFACLSAPSVAARLADPVERVRFVNKIAWIRFSNLLYGEQGALNLSASLCDVLRDQGAQEFAANQTREEARHVTAFSRYIKARWGRPAPVLPALARFLTEIIEAPDVSKKIIGMQVMVEGLAMGSLGSLYRTLLDPVGKRLVQLVMTDEAFHHKFGKLWADETMPRLSPTERQRLEAWTSHCLHDFIVKMNSPFELQVLHKDFGLDPMIVAREMQNISDERIVDTALGSREIFRVLTQTLINAGLLNAESQLAYRTYVADNLVGDIETAYEDIVADGLAFLRDVNENSEAIAATRA
jgi:hypothetical protein